MLLGIKVKWVKKLESVTQNLEIQSMGLNNWQLRYQNANIIGKRLNNRYKRKWL